MFIDSHCHIQFKAFDADREDVLARCVEHNTILNVVGTQKNTSKLALELAEKYDWIYATVGLHPIQEYKTKVVEESTEFVARGEDFDEVYYDELAKSPNVIAVGETGLDRFHIPKETKVEEVMGRQKQIFRQHYKFAKKHDLPLVIHVRDAHEDMLEVLETFEKPIRGVIHCFSGSWEVAEKYLDFGLHLGFTGIITFPPKKTDPQTQLDLIEVVEKTPLDCMLIETDAPYLAPQAHRGKRSEPWMVEEVAKKIAEIKEKPLEEVQKQVYTNTRKLFDRIR